MKIENVVQLTKDALTQSMGKEYMKEIGVELNALNYEKLVDIGKDIADVEGMIEKFTKSLLVRVARLDIMDTSYSPLLNDIMIDSFEWGGFVERVYPKLSDVMEDPMWSLVDGKSYSDIENTFFQPKVEVKIFEEGKPIMIPISIQEEMVKEAFTGWEEMNRFISSIRTKVNDTKAMILDAYAHMLVNTAIGISDKALQNSVHLVTDAVADGVIPSAPENVKELLNNKDFLRYCTRKIADVKENMRASSVAYNNGNFAIQGKNLKGYINSQFANAIEYRLENDIVTNNFFGINGFKKIPQWQANKDTSKGDFDFSTVTSIVFASDVNNKLGIGTTSGEVKIEKAVGVLIDGRAIGICPLREKTTSNYTACADFWNEYLHIFVSYILDSNFPIVAFMLD